jgi:hypothetical protein
MQILTIIGRRWFNKRTGNTYHSATIIVDGEPVERVEYTYGYGDQYLDSAMNKLVELKLIDKPNEPLHLWAEKNKVRLTYMPFDVKTKKEL